ncbi:MAG: hypothetical protein KatS3mg110_0467 [Pirellulaceae bacterium]|nr:MAG: hypothetical protein KatS3mg110_0467 [Pirellulaceae bacterium]
MERRGLDEHVIREVLAHPEQRLPVRPGRDVLHSRREVGGVTYLIRCLCRRRSLAGRSRHSLPNELRLKILEQRDMKVTYDAKTDTLTVIFKGDAQVAESDEVKPGVILDYDEDGNLVSLEVLDASRRVSEARKIEFQTTE